MGSKAETVSVDPIGWITNNEEANEFYTALPPHACWYKIPIKQNVFYPGGSLKILFENVSNVELNVLRGSSL